MANIQSAGFCSHCNRAVTIRRESGPGLLRRISSLVSGQEAEAVWECTKCGRPASKSFKPNSQAGQPSPASSSPSPRLATGGADPPPPDLPSEYRNCPHCRGSIRREAFKCLHCKKEVTPLPRLAEASCHVCSKTIPFEPQQTGHLQTCPSCTNQVCLPQPEEDRAPKTTAPPVITFPDDPARPSLTLAMCVACEHRLTYQKKHAGRRLACPKCGKSLILP